MIVNKAMLHCLSMPTIEAAIADIEAYLVDVNLDETPPPYIDETKLLQDTLKTVLVEKRD